jgi:phosphatidate cytidylyltransferase
MARRAITSLILLGIGFPTILFGGVPFFIFISIFLIGAAWEFGRLYRAMELRPFEPLTLGGTLLLLLVRSFFPQWAAALLSGLILLALTVHLFEYERGRDKAALDLLATLGCMLYIGWVGAYLIDLRFLPHGGWWIMTVLPIVWLCDTGAYAIGAAYGQHKMTPRLSPKKSWEGYLAGVITAIAAGIFFAWVYAAYGALRGEIQLWQGAVLGLILGLLTTLGDLGESLIKREAGMKDSSNIIPGHGGFFDRIDSWLWAGVLGYYYITWFLK